MKKKKKISAEKLLKKYLLAVEGTSVKDFNEAKREEPEIHQAILDAMEEYKNQFIGD